MDKPIINIRAWKPLESKKKEEKLEPLFTTSDSNNFEDISIHNYKDKKIKQENIIQETTLNEINGKEYSNENEQHKKKFSTDIFDKYHNSDYLFNKITDQNDDCSNYYEKYLSNKKSKKKQIDYSNKKIFKIVTTSVGAIATGMLLGYFMLNFFATTIENMETSITNSSNNNQVSIADNNQVSAGQTFNGRTIYILQAGVFSNISGAEAIVSKLQDMGKAAVIQSSDSFYVYIGVSNIKDNAALLKELLISEDIDVYAKEYQIPKKSFNMSDTSFLTFSNWISVGNQIVTSLSEQTTLALVNNGYKIDFNSLQKLHQEFLLDVQSLKTSLAEENLDNELELVNDMSDQIYYSISAMNAYDKNSNNNYLWDIQELILNYELLYNNF